MLMLHRIDDLNWALYEDGKDTGFRWRLGVQYEKTMYVEDNPQGYDFGYRASFTEIGDVL